MRLSRADSSLLTQWWFTIDRLLLTAVLVLVLTGLLVSLAASPSVAIAKELEAFYFVKRHVVFAVIGVTLVIALSLQSPHSVRHISLVLYLAAVGLLVWVLVAGVEINGAQRWIRVLGISVQPSEIAKPSFVVLSAWAFAEWQKRRDMPGLPIAILVYGLLATLLLMQPDIGQTALITIVWGTLFVLAGIPLLWVGGLAGAVTIAATSAYYSMGHVKARIEQFFGSAIDPRSQAGQAYNSFVEGAFFGRGPGEGTIKTSLPDAHTDFIFAVIAEEYGIIACLGLLLIYALIVYRALARAVLEHDLATRYAVAGLALLFATQAIVNMGVNIGLLPVTGMTLPMISAGGSSMIGVSITLGMLLALSRRRSRAREFAGPGPVANRPGEFAPVSSLATSQVPSKSQIQ